MVSSNRFSYLRFLPLVPHMVGKLRTTPVRAPGLELELVAHNQGAFYKRHIDTQTASDRKSLRVLSGVYYFHAVPKAFTGGELRLYAIGAENAPFVDIAPERNSLLVFPSWAPHEVRPISCSSGRFIDFALCHQLLGTSIQQRQDLVADVQSTGQTCTICVAT